jgi:hypothetical protein
VLFQWTVVAQADAGATPQLLRSHGRHVNEEKSTFNGGRLHRRDGR